MTEKKKMSVAEILAAARKADGNAEGGEKAAEAPAARTPSEAPTETVASEAAAEVAAEKPETIEKPKPAAKPAAGGARPSVAEMLAMARANKPAAAAAPAAPKPAAKKEAPAKPAAKAAPKADAPAKESAAPGGPKDTASILAAARAGQKPGPISKEAAAKLAADKPAPGAVAKADGKTKPVAPPMPPKPDYAKPKAAKAGATDEDRRGFIGFMLGTMVGIGFTALSATAALWSLGTARFMFPNILTEPPSQFKVGFPADFPPGSVSEKFKAQFGVWLVNYEYNGRPEIFALRTVCTHLGCTPNWLEGEQKYKCPCHGSGFYKDGINFEGPAPRPLERFAIRIADDGQIEVDKSRLFQEELGQWVDPASFVPV
jgi:cytochrome b6-f complex iron-sulfur subunit